MAATGNRASTLRFGRWWWIVPILAFLALSSWSVASPVGSSPDEDFHLASIWCGAGDRAGLCEAASDPGARRVPAVLVGTAECYAFAPTRSASCQGSELSSTVLKSTERGNFQGHLYPPVYYAAMSVFVSHDIEASVVVMRLVNCALFVGLTTGLWLLLPRRRRGTLLWSAALTSIPLGVFLIASLNPSGWAVVSASTLWIALLGFYESEGRRRAGLGALAAVAAVMGAGARADSALFVVVAVGIAAVLSFRPRRSFWISSILPAALVAFAAVMFRLASQADAGSTGLTGAAPPTGTALRQIVLRDFFDVPDLWAGVFGRWGLGWLDTVVPDSVWVAGLALFGAAIAYGLSSGSPRKFVIVAGLLVAAWLYPLILLVQSNRTVGEYVQPRYVLPLLYLLVGVSLLRASGRFSGLRRVHLVIAIAILSTSNAVSLFFNLRRYVTGTDVVSVNLNAQLEWWWRGAPGPMELWVVGAACFTAMMVGIAAPAWASLDATRRPVLADRTPALEA